MNSNTLWRGLLRYTLVSTLALVGLTSRPGTILAQVPGSNCTTVSVGTTSSAVVQEMMF